MKSLCESFSMWDPGGPAWGDYDPGSPGVTMRCYVTVLRCGSERYVILQCDDVMPSANSSNQSGTDV